MDIPTLHTLCIRSLATEVENCSEIDDVLKDDEKLKLMSCLKIENEFQKRIALRKLFDKWKFKRIYLNSNHLSVLIYNVKIHGLEQLSLNSITQKSLERIRTLLTENHETPYHNLDILKLIELFIPDNREHLWHLNISCCDIRSVRNMFEEMAQLFPNITQLVLNGTNLTDQNFNNICRCYPNLTHLSVGYNYDLSDLSGISVLQNLKTLNLTACNIGNGLKIRELFTLSNLSVLDISGYRGRALSQNLTNYLSCDRTLPQLKFIDVSFNAVTGNQIRTLVITHPTLSIVSLIGTPYQCLEQVQLGGVELVTIRSIKSCIRAMRRYSFAAPQKGQIMDRLIRILYVKYENQEESVLRKCLHELLDIGRYDHLYAQRQAVRCVYWLCRNGRMDKFGLVEVQKILSFFLNVCPSISRVDDLSEDVITLQALIWHSISESRIIPTLIGSAEYLCLRAAEVMKRSLCSHSMRADVYHFCFTALKNILIHNPGAYQHIIADQVLIKKILMHVSLLTKSKIASIEICEIGNLVISHSANIITPKLITAHSTALLECSIQFQADERKQTAIQNYLENLINSNRLAPSVYFEEPCFSWLTKCIKLRGFRAQKLTIMLLCWVKHSSECLAKKRTPESFSRMEARAIPIINTIYWYPGSHNMDIYEHLVRNGRGEVRKWAKWIQVLMPISAQPAVQVQPVRGVQPDAGLPPAVEVQPVHEEQPAVEENQ
ncbi:hypothetical protein CAEBREN_25383 [Caenorhabditis brenneri]|uniref:Uncharacterized protein n=1 Tax=Caenorhabditis brenneri TaxID=135651 RepID=G0MBA0_CAEBE|nr:hypothetical protein CAEBREN_25383 [Caenorhabditis brenneri]